MKTNLTVRPSYWILLVTLLLGAMSILSSTGHAVGSKSMSPVKKGPYTLGVDYSSLLKPDYAPKEPLWTLHPGQSHDEKFGFEFGPFEIHGSPHRSPAGVLGTPHSSKGPYSEDYFIFQEITDF